MEVLKIAAVTKKYNKQFVLNNVSFNLCEGEIVGLVGPNGAGKTTLMRIIVGLIRNFDGKIICKVDRKSIARGNKLFGCMIEAPKFYPYMTGYQNLQFFSSMLGKVNRKSLNKVISLTGLSTAIRKKTKAYSLGMRQRLGIAQALIGEPKILILDEPTNGLDPYGVKEIRDYLKKIVEKQNVSIIVSSHTLSDIERICDKVVVLKKGKVVEIIDTHEISKEDTVFAFETNDIEKFHELIKQQNIVIEVAKENIIKIRLQRENLSAFIKALVAEDINFSSVYEVKETLEEKFLDLTGGNKIV